MGAVLQGLTTVGRAGDCTSVYQQSLTWKLKNRGWGPSRSFHQELTEMGSKRPETRLQPRCPPRRQVAHGDLCGSRRYGWRQVLLWHHWDTD